RRESRFIDQNHNWCHRHKEPKAIVGLRFGKRVWQCFHENCLSQRNMMGDVITVGGIVLALHPKHGRHRVWSIGEDRFAILQMVGSWGNGNVLTDQWDEI